MGHSAFAQTKARYQDLGKLIDYRKYSGEWNTWFEDNFLTPRLQALGYAHVRFFGGSRC